jgi:hypothetical protein
MFGLWKSWCGCVSGLHLQFISGQRRLELEMTFKFLGALMALIMGLTMVWAVAAGVLQTGRLIGSFQQVFPAIAQNDRCSLWMACSSWISLIGVVFYSLKAAAVVTIIGLASAMVGALLGFLFGVPRRISDAPNQPAPPPAGATGSGSAGAATTAAAAPPSAAAVAAARGWQSSTNLTQISDWLTKIIVGVGLVESHSIYAGMLSASETISTRMFAGAVGSSLVIPAVIIGSAIIGFLYAYLLTQLFLAELMVATDSEIGNFRQLTQEPDMQETIGVLATMSAASSPIAPPISESMRQLAADTGDAVAMANLGPKTVGIEQPTEAQLAAANALNGVTLESLSNPHDILAWARSRAIQNKYEAAAQAYRKLVTPGAAPELLAEAARVLMAAKSTDEARGLVARAAADWGHVAPEVGARILRDAAFLYLDEASPRGAKAALELLTDDALKYDPYGVLHVQRACANGQRYVLEKLSDQDKVGLKQQIMDDIETALRTNPKNVDWVRYLSDPNGAGKTAGGAMGRDNCLEAFGDDGVFRALLTRYAVKG